MAIQVPINEIKCKIEFSPKRDAIKMGDAIEKII